MGYTLYTPFHIEGELILHTWRSPTFILFPNSQNLHAIHRGTRFQHPLPIGGELILHTHGRSTASSHPFPNSHFPKLPNLYTIRWGYAFCPSLSVGGELILPHLFHVEQSFCVHITQIRIAYTRIHAYKES